MPIIHNSSDQYPNSNKSLMKKGKEKKITHEIMAMFMSTDLGNRRNFRPVWIFQGWHLWHIYFDLKQFQLRPPVVLCSSRMSLRQAGATIDAPLFLFRPRGNCPRCERTPLFAEVVSNQEKVLTTMGYPIPPAMNT